MSSLLRSFHISSLPAYVWILLILVLTGVLYAPTLWHWFLTDDYLFIHAFRQEGALGYIKDAFDVSNAPPAPEVRFYRPLHSTAFLALHSVLGLEPIGYHAWSLGVHLLNVGLLWLVAFRLTRRPVVAGLAAIIFALHPAYAPAVTWISNNNALMATSASLFAFWAFLRWEDAGSGGRLWYWTSVVAYGIALLFHPEAGTLLVVLAAHRIFRTLKDWRDTEGWQRGAAGLAPYLAIALSYVVIHQWMVDQEFLPQSGVFELTNHVFSVYVSYFSTAVYPIPLDQVAGGSPRHMFAAGCLMLAMLFLVVTSRSRPYLGAFAVLWFVAAVFPLTTVDQFFSDIYGIEAQGRKMYSAGPALGFMLAVLLARPVEVVAAAGQKYALAAFVAVGVLALVLCSWLLIERQAEQGDQAADTERFVTQLQGEYPEIQPGSRLYLSNLPISLRFFQEIYLPSLVGLYYDDVTVVVSGSAPEVPIEGDIVFRYEPDD